MPFAYLIHTIYPDSFPVPTYFFLQRRWKTGENSLSIVVDWLNVQGNLHLHVEIKLRIITRLNCQKIALSKILANWPRNWTFSASRSPIFVRPSLDAMRSSQNRLRSDWERVCHLPVYIPCGASFLFLQKKTFLAGYQLHLANNVWNTECLLQLKAHTVISKSFYLSAKRLWQVMRHFCNFLRPAVFEIIKIHFTWREVSDSRGAHFAYYWHMYERFPGVKCKKKKKKETTTKL